MYTPLLKGPGKDNQASDGRNANSKTGTPAVLKEVQKLVKDRNFDEARSLLLKAIEEEPENAAFLLIISKLQTFSKEYESAFVFAQRSSKADPLNAKALIQQATIKFKLEQYADALEIIDASLSIDPRSLKSFHLQQRIYGKTNDFSKLISCCDTCLSLYPFDARSYYNKANAFISQNNTDVAEQLLVGAVLMVPKSSSLYALLGEIYSLKDQYSKAIASYQQSILCQKSSRPTLHIKLAKCFLEFSDYTNCRESLNGYDSALKSVKRKSISKKIESRYQYTYDFIYACSLKEYSSAEPYIIGVKAILRRMLIDDKTLHGAIPQEMSIDSINDLPFERIEELVKAGVASFELKSRSDDDDDSIDDEFSII